MQVRSTNTLHFKSAEYLPTIEVERDAPEGFPGYVESILLDAVREHISNYPCAVATFYLAATKNLNCDKSNNFTVIGIAGSTKVFETFFAKYVSKKWLCARRGHLLSQDQFLPVWHIEDGRLWEKYDDLTWLSADYLDEFHPFTLYFCQETGMDPYLLWQFGNDWETLTELRYIIRSYLRITGEAIRFIDPEGHLLRGNAKIANLKKRWLKHLDKEETWRFSNFEEFDDAILLGQLRQVMENLLAFPGQAIQFIDPSGQTVHDNTKLDELKKVWEKQAAALEKLVAARFEKMCLS
ncbi:MAG: hypothetical protein K2Y28_06035 [Burkholderiaceae bacterium]|nr:hypothetical protein [Burkholderiaceae bacterium]